MKDDPLTHTLWKTTTEAGFIAGVVGTVSQLVGYTGYRAAIVALLVMIAAWITVFNIKLFHRNKLQLPLFHFVSGHDATFELLTSYVKNAQESIWVTRFSKGSIDAEDDYFSYTNRKILGDKRCKAVYDYRRLMSIDTPDKAELVVNLIELAGSRKNFYLRKTELVNFFELLIIDEKYAIIMFHEKESHGTVNGALVISEPNLVTRFKSIYESMWSSPKSQPIKNRMLSQDEQDKVMADYKDLMKKLPEPELSEESLQKAVEH